MQRMPRAPLWHGNQSASSGHEEMQIIQYQQILKVSQNDQGDDIIQSSQLHPADSSHCYENTLPKQAACRLHLTEGKHSHCPILTT